MTSSQRECIKKAISSTLKSNVIADLKSICAPVSKIGFNAVFYSRFINHLRINCLSNHHQWLQHLYNNICKYQLNFENQFHFRPGISIDFLNTFPKSKMTEDMREQKMNSAIYLSNFSKQGTGEVIIFTSDLDKSSFEHLKKLEFLLNYYQEFKEKTQNILEKTAVSIPSSYLELENQTTKNLTSRQIECLRYLVQGMSIKQIAKVLDLSPKTVEHHLDSIKRRLNCRSRYELISKALRMSSIYNHLLIE